MPSIQDTLANASAKVQRKLFDLNIHLTGREVEVIRFFIAEENKYGDETILPLSQNTITAVINYPPGEIPLYRFRKAGTGGEPTVEDVADTGLFFYDILPFEVYTKWEDKVEKGDFILHTVKDEVGNKMGILLRMANALGSFSTELIWKKCLFAPYSGTVPAEIQAYMDANF